MFNKIRGVELHAFILGRHKDDYRVVISITRTSPTSKSSEMYRTTITKDALIDALDQPTEVYQVLGNLEEIE